MATTGTFFEALISYYGNLSTEALGAMRLTREELRAGDVSVSKMLGRMASLWMDAAEGWWSALLVNVTRGEVIVEDALVRAIQGKQIRGAALDVAPREPLPPDSALWDMENVVMTPHTAGASQYRAGRNIDRFVRNLEHLRRNEPLEGVIDKQLGY